MELISTSQKQLGWYIKHVRCEIP